MLVCQVSDKLTMIKIECSVFNLTNKYFVKYEEQQKLKHKIWKTERELFER